MESDYFRNLLKVLKHSYNLPTAEETHTVSLNKAFEKLQFQKEIFIDRPGTLLSVMHNDKDEGICHIKLFTVDINGKNRFLNLTEIRIIEKNNEPEIFQILRNAIDEAKNPIRLEIFSISKERFIHDFENKNVFSLACNIEIANIIGNSLMNNNLYLKSSGIMVESLKSKFLSQVMDNNIELLLNENYDHHCTWKTHYDAYSFF